MVAINAGTVNADTGVVSFEPFYPVQNNGTTTSGGGGSVTSSGNSSGSPVPEFITPFWAKPIHGYPRLLGGMQLLFKLLLDCAVDQYVRLYFFVHHAAFPKNSMPILTCYPLQGVYCQATAST